MNYKLHLKVLSYDIKNNQTELLHIIRIKKGDVKLIFF
jgi:hypothetical protein